MDSSRPPPAGGGLQPSTPPVRLRTTHAGGPGARSTRRQAERSTNRPAGARPSSRRGWRGARSARQPRTTGRAIEREPERAPLHAVQKVVAPALGEGSAAWWLIGGALAL